MFTPPTIIDAEKTTTVSKKERNGIRRNQTTKHQVINNGGGSLLKYVIILIAIGIFCYTIWYIILPPENFHIPRYIELNCSKATSTSRAICEIEDADSTIDFATLRIGVRNLTGQIIANWSAPIQFINGTCDNDTAKNPIIRGVIIDNGDKHFGIHDEIQLYNIRNTNLIGFEVIIFGPDAQGLDHIE